MPSSGTGSGVDSGLLKTGPLIVASPSRPSPLATVLRSSATIFGATERKLLVAAWGDTTGCVTIWRTLTAAACATHSTERRKLLRPMMILPKSGILEGWG
eukprot:1596012-Pleurochrysis_carterae.AAC.2